MAEARQTRREGRPEPLARTLAKVLDPICAKRGLSQAALLASWPEIIGPRYANCTSPERIAWPRRPNASDPPGGTLVLRVDGGRAIHLQHEVQQVMERVNSFLGFNAIARIKLVQAPVARSAGLEPPAQAALPPDRLAALDGTLSGIDSADLRAALRELGQAVLSESTAGQGEETP